MNKIVTSEENEQKKNVERKIPETLKTTKQSTLNIYLKHCVLTLTAAIRVAPTQDDAGPC